VCQVDSGPIASVKKSGVLERVMQSPTSEMANGDLHCSWFVTSAIQDPGVKMMTFLIHIYIYISRDSSWRSWLDTIPMIARKCLHNGNPAVVGPIASTVLESRIIFPFNIEATGEFLQGCPNWTRVLSVLSVIFVVVDIQCSYIGNTVWTSFYWTCQTSAVSAVLTTLLFRHFCINLTSRARRLNLSTNLSSTPCWWLRFQ
jgi:hypothetical protein